MANDPLVFNTDDMRTVASAIGLHIPFAYKRLALGLQTPQDVGEEWLEDIYDVPDK